MTTKALSSSISAVLRKQWIRFKHSMTGPTTRGYESHSVGVLFDSSCISYVMLEMIGREVVLNSYKTLVLDKNIVNHAGKIIDMDKLAYGFIDLSSSFIHNTNRIVTSLPTQSMITMEYFDFDPKSQNDLEEEAEFRAKKMNQLDDILFDYSLKNDGSVKNNVFLAVTKKDEVEARQYLAELCDLNLKYLDPWPVACINAFSYWINQEIPELEKEVISIFDIGYSFTNVVLAKTGRLLYTDKINMGIENLLQEIPEYHELSREKVFSLLHQDIDLSSYADYIDGVRNRLVQEIKRSIRLFDAQSTTEISEQDEVTHILLTGLGAKVFDIKEPLNAATPADMAVSVVNPVESVQSGRESPQFAFDAYELTVAFGLALRGFL